MNVENVREEKEDIFIIQMHASDMFITDVEGKPMQMEVYNGAAVAFYPNPFTKVLI